MVPRWLPLCGCFALAVLAPAHAAEAEAAKELAAATRKATAVKSYSFQVREGPGPVRPVVGKYQSGQPLSLEAEGISFYRKGDVLVYLDAGKWQRTRRGTLSDPLRILGASYKVTRTVPPHVELAGLGKDLTGVKKAVEKGETVYTGTLSAAAAKKWAPTESRDVAQGGTVRAWVRGGNVVKYEVSVRLKGKRGNAEVDGTFARIVEVSAVGTTKVEPPAAARKALE